MSNTASVKSSKATSKFAGSKSANKSLDSFGCKSRDVVNKDIFYASIDRAVILALTSVELGSRQLPLKYTMASHIDECGLIHITAFKFARNGREYAEYYLPATCSRGRRYLDQFPEYIQMIEHRQAEEDFYTALQKQEEDWGMPTVYTY